MSINRQLLAIIGRRFPAIYDVIPRGPLSRMSAVALNPQPLPPLELGAALASEFILTLYFADRFGLESERAFTDLDDWCPTRPRRLKLPPWWPPIPDPEPEPEWLVALHFGFAARLAVASPEFEGTRAGESLERAVERSVGALETLVG
jgi:hypothetical protein